MYHLLIMEKASTILYLLLLSFLPAFSQVSSIRVTPSPMDIIQEQDSVDQAQLRVQYHVEFRATKEDCFLSESMQALDIGNCIVKFFENSWTYAFSHLPKEIQERSKWNSDTLMLASSMAREKSSKYKKDLDVIMRHYHGSDIQTVFRSLDLDNISSFTQGTKFFYDEPIPQFEWELMDGDTIICGYPCQRASTSFRGRSWKVWYALEVPYQEGPWKLRGLPGLILKAEDTNNDFRFTAIEIIQPMGKIISKQENENLYSKVSAKRMEEMTVFFYKNPSGYARMAYGEKLLKTMEMMGQRIRSDSRTPCLIEKYE